MESTTTSAERAAWRVCAPGELVELAGKQRRRQSRRALLRGLTAAAAGCTIVGSLGVLWSRAPNTDSPQSEIACDEVSRLLSDYVAHKLDHQREVQVRQHLAGCAHCTAALNKLQHGSAAQG